MSNQDKTIERYTSKIGADFLHRVIDGHTGKLLFTDQIAERMNRYELLLQRAKRLSLNSRNYSHTGSEYSRVESIDIQFLDKSIDEIIDEPLTKTVERLLQEWLDAANHLEYITNKFLRNQASKEQIEIANEKLRDARSAYEGSQS